MKIAVESKAAAAKDAEEKSQMKTAGFLECFVSLFDSEAFFGKFL